MLHWPVKVLRRLLINLLMLLKLGIVPLNLVLVVYLPVRNTAVYDAMMWLLLYLIDHVFLGDKFFEKSFNFFISLTHPTEF